MTRATDDGQMVLVELTEDAPADGEIVTILLKALLETEITVDGVVVGKRTLEERFLKMTTRLEDHA